MTNSKNTKTIVLLFTLALASSSSFAGSVSKKAPPIVDGPVLNSSVEIVTEEAEEESLLEKMINLLSF